MPLITCPDCSHECSDAAPVCPKCGRPLDGRKSLAKKSLGFEGVEYAVMLIGGVILAVSGDAIGWFLIGAGALLLVVRLKLGSGVKRK